MANGDERKIAQARVGERTQDSPMTELVAAGAPGILPGEALVSQARRAWVENITLLLAYKRFIIVVAILATIATAIYAFSLKNNYTAVTFVLPARKSGGGLLDNLTSGLSSTIKDLGLTKIGSGGDPSGSYSPLSLITSREMRERLVKKYDLVKVYDVEHVQDAVKEFGAHATADLAKEGYFVVTFEDTDPTRAANIANDMVDDLNQTNVRLAIEEAKVNRTFVERRFNKSMADLDTAEARLNRFHRQYGVYALPEQASAQFGAMASMEQAKSSAEIQLHSAEQMFGNNAPEVSVLRTVVQELAGKLAEMKVGLDSKAASYFVPMKVLPDLAIEYMRLTREFEIQSKLKAFLLPAFEQSKLDETKNSLAFVVLDRAVPPHKKSGPRRSIMLLVALLGSAVLTSLLVLGYVRVRQARGRFVDDQVRLGLKSR